MPGDILRKHGKPFITNNIHLKYYSSITNIEAEKLIGKKIAKIEADKYSCTFIFTDGSKFHVHGYSQGEDGPDALETRYEEKTIKI